MALKTKTVQITSTNRDHGKTFLLTEMPAMQAESWAVRALLALTRSGLEIPAEIANAGMAGVATLGLKALSGVQYEDIEPLMREMFDKCVLLMPRPDVTRKVMTPDDIEEVSTLLLLRKEVFQLHVDFSLADVLTAKA